MEATIEKVGFFTGLEMILYWFGREEVGEFKLKKESRMTFPGWISHINFCLGQILEYWILSLSFVLPINDKHRLTDLGSN